MKLKHAIFQRSWTNERKTLTFILKAALLIFLMEFRFDLVWKSLGVHETYILKLIIYGYFLVTSFRCNYRGFKHLHFIAHCLTDDYISPVRYRTLHIVSLVNIVSTFLIITYSFSSSVACTIRYFFQW